MLPNRLSFVLYFCCLLLAACAPEPVVSIEKRILFVGNSYTHQHRVPNQVVTRLNKRHGPDVAYEAFVVADDGRNLIKYVDDTRILNALNAQAFDYIVLQDQSAASFYQRNRDEFLRAMRWFKAKADAESAEIVLYQTWPRRPGHSFYRERAGRGFTPPKTPQEMRFRVERAYQKAADMFGAQVAPVGNCWMQQDNLASLYQPDGSHASAKGAALASRVIADTIAGEQEPCLA